MTTARTIVCMSVLSSFLCREPRKSSWAETMLPEPVMIPPFHGVLHYNDDSPPHLHPIEPLVADLQLHLTWHESFAQHQRLE